MRYWTWLEIKTKIEADLDLQDEVFITDSELLAYANEAIDEAEAEIHTLYEDYFLSRATLTFVSGTESYDLPATIYGNKIRAIIYKNGTTVFKIKRIKDWKKFEEYADNTLDTGSTTWYEYFIDNTTAGTPKIILTPTPREAGNLATIWFCRNANRLTGDASICDIPEFVSFVIQYVKKRCYEKEGHSNLPGAIQDLEQQRNQMVSTLSQMCPDNDNLIEADFTSYEEMS